MLLALTHIQHNKKKKIAYLAKSPFIIILQRRGLLSTNNAQGIFPKITGLHCRFGGNTCSGGVISCGYVESLVSGVLAARGQGYQPPRAGVNARRCWESCAGTNSV